MNPLGRYASLYDEADIETPTDGFDINRGLPPEFEAALLAGTAHYGPWRVHERGEDALRQRQTKIRALIRQIDDSMGRLLELLDLDRTVVAFTSDHGDYGGHRGLAGKVPWIPFEDLVRVPLVVGGAGIAAGREVTSRVQSSDLPLTLCDLAGVEVPAPIEEFDSRSLTPWLGCAGAADGADRPELFTTNPGWPSARLGSLKLICHWPSGAQALFDLDEDPHESVNVAEDPMYRDGLDELAAIVRTAFLRPPPRLPTYDAASTASYAV